MTKDEALKLALEALENLFGIPDKWTGEGGGDVAVWRLGGSYRAQQAITAIKEALAQPEQEPVAWRGYNWSHSPDDWVYRDFDDPILDGNGNNVGQPLYTTPPQRTWVGLTDEEIALIVAECASSAHRHDDFSFARAIEAALRSKNNA